MMRVEGRMLTHQARSIDILVAVAAVAFFLVDHFYALGPVATGIGIVLFAVYLGWLLKRRSPYGGKPGDLHLNS
jgi:hypothetical protein